MKLFLHSILCLVFGFTLQAQSTDIFVYGRVVHDSLDIDIPQDIHVTMDNGFEFVFITEEDGTFAFDLPVVIDDSLSCGTAFIINCFGDFNEQRFCVSPDTDSLYLEFSYCEQSTYCPSSIEYIIKEDGTVEVFASHYDYGIWSYQWSNGDSTNNTSAEIGEEVCLTTTQWIGEEGCSYTSCKTIVDFPDCEVVIYDSNGGLFGFEEGVTLHAEGQGGEVISYVWSTGDSTQAIIVAEPGVYCVDVIFTEGCEAAACYEVFDITPYDSCYAYVQPIFDEMGNLHQLEVFTFNDRAPTYLWSSGDTSAIITPDTSGNYCVEVTFDECSINACYQYLTPGDCTLEIWSDPFGFEAGLYADYRSSGRGDIRYQWSNGAVDPWIFVYSPGEYCVTVTNAQGCEKSACKTVTPDSNYYDYCWLALRENYTEDGKGIIAESYNPNLSYNWSTGETGQIIYPESTGDYCVTATDDSGCETTGCIYFYVKGDCAIDVVEEYFGGRLYLYPISYGEGNITYSWDNGIDSFGYSYPVDTAGEYCVTMTDEAGCTATWCNYVEPYNGEFCEAYIYEEWNGDEGGLYRVEAFGEGPFTYQWDDGSIGDSIILNKSGVYCVTVTDAAGCAISTCVEVYEREECYVYLDYSVGIVSDTFVTAYAYGRPPFRYEWSTGDTTDTIEYPDSSVCVTVTDANGCVSEACSYFIDYYECEAYIEFKLSDAGDSILSVYTFGQEVLSYLWDSGDSTQQVPYTGDINCVTVVFASGCETVVCYSDVPEASGDFVGFTINTIDSVNQLDVEASIDVFYMEDNEIVEVAETEIVYLGGTAIVFVKGGGEYLVRATADGYMPTYYRSTLFWDEANPIFAGFTTDAPVYDLKMISQHDSTGVGLIGGSVSAGGASLRLGNTRSEDPVQGATILITQLDGTPVTYQYTSHNGKFAIGDLPLGSYLVIMDMPGQEKVVRVVHLKSGHEHEQNVNFVVNTNQDNTTAATDLLDDSNVHIYPNPAIDFLQLQLSDRLDNVSVSIFDLSGQLMLTHRVENPENERIDLHNLTAAGMYQLILTADQGSIAKKFVKIN